jgi:hypothetical protein
MSLFSTNISVDPNKLYELLSDNAGDIFINRLEADMIKLSGSEYLSDDEKMRLESDVADLTAIYNRLQVRMNLADKLINTRSIQTSEKARGNQ